MLFGVGWVAPVVADNVAIIGETGYETLAAAFTAATNSQTITITSDIADFGTISVGSKTVTLDLNGKTAKGQYIYVNNATAHLIIKDGTATATPSFNKTDNTATYTSGALDFTDKQGYIWLSQGGSVEVQSGTVKSDYYCPFFVQGNTSSSEPSISSTLTITDGYVYGRWYGVSVYGRGATADVAGGLVYSGGFPITGNGTANQGGTKINISGGTLVSNVSNGMSCAIYHPQSGELNITGGELHSVGGCGVLMRGGTLNMTAGTITATGEATQTGQVGDAKGPAVPTAGIVFDKSAGYYDAANVSIEVSGTASVNGAKAAISVVSEDDETAKKAIEVYAGTFSSDVSDFLTEAADMTESDGSYSVITKYVAKVGDTKYEPLADAFSKAESGATITVLADITDYGKIKVENKSLTLDLNGKDITGTYLVASTGASLTLKDGTATEAPVLNDDYSVKYKSGIVTAEFLQAQKGGAIDVQSGTVKSSVNTYCPIYCYGNYQDEGDALNSTVTISGGYVEGFYYAVSAQGRKATINVTGGIVFSQAYTISGNGTDQTGKRYGGTELNISGGKIVARNGKAENTSDIFTCAIYQPQQGTVNISGGEVYSTFGTGILMRSGTLNMTAGKVVALGDANWTQRVASDTCTHIPTSGIVYHCAKGYVNSDKVKINITGKDCYVSGMHEAISLVEATNSDNVTTTAGVYSHDVTAFCPEGYASVLRNDKLYEVGTGVMITYNDQGTKIQDGNAFTIDDVKDNYLNKIVVNKAAENATITLNKAFSIKWSAFCVPFTFTLTDELLKQFSFAEIWDTALDPETSATTIEYIVMKAGETLTAGMPYLVKANADATSTMQITAATLSPTADMTSHECSTIKQRFTFYGTTVNTVLLENKAYYFDADQQSLRATTNAETFVGPLSFYLTIQDKQTGDYVYPSSSANAPKAVKVLIVGDTTGIADIETTTSADEQGGIYTLQGVFVGASTQGLARGLYIINGKKTIIK